MRFHSRRYSFLPLSLTTIFIVLLESATKVTACSTPGNYIVTFYGYPDNSPPGPGTAHNCGGRNFVAGGTGTYSDPVTFATAPGEFNVCEIIYLPLLTKYGRYEDDCAQCSK